MIKKQGTILIVDDNRNILTTVRMLLEPIFDGIITIANPNSIPAKLREEHPDVVLLDMNFSSGINSGNEGLYWLREIKSLSPKTEVVLFTAYADIQLAVTGIKEGAADFIVKPFENEKMIRTLVEARDKNRAVDNVINRNGGKPGGKDAQSAMYWGDSEVMNNLRSIVEKVAATDANILITGENGTGKEVLANEIHRLSTRCGKKMLPVDMGAITETLFESELFGHVKGAFTDAKVDKPGKFELADGSTIFLDEIGNLSFPNCSATTGSSFTSSCPSTTTIPSRRNKASFALVPSTWGFRQSFVNSPIGWSTSRLGWEMRDASPTLWTLATEAPFCTSAQSTISGECVKITTWRSAAASESSARNCLTASGWSDSSGSSIARSVPGARSLSASTMNIRLTTPSPAPSVLCAVCADERILT